VAGGRMTLTIGLSLVITAIVFLLIGWFVNSYFGKKSYESLKIKAEDLLDNAKRESENLKKEKLLEANEEFYNLKQKLEDEFRNKKQSLQNLEHQLNERDSNVDRKADYIAKKEQELDQFEKDIRTQEQQNQQKNEKLTRLIGEQNEMLEKIAGLTSEEAKQILLDNLIDEAKQNASKSIHNIVEEAKFEATKRAQNIVITAIQQSGINMALESTVSVVNLPSDDMKGRIIGREGRNIRAFEIVTGVDVIVDDTPGSIILSGFDPLRREISRIVMERLVADGRIHPARIEDMFEKVTNEMDEYLSEMGAQALLDCGIHGVHTELAKLIGKLRFRVSFGQNVLQHSKEVSTISGIIAAELGLDVNFAKRAGILHDIGRAAERSSDGNHAQIGAEIAKKYNENPIVLNAIAAHHGDVEPNSPISVIVQTANEISSIRPGARREAIENFITRLKQMEAIAESFEGVQRSFAIQAGKEVRVIVSHDKVDDVQLNLLAQDIAKKIEEEVEYPGQIKVVVIREFRGVDFA
jgi:ribonuclease Y